jgi:hypothetical protein
MCFYPYFTIIVQSKRRKKIKIKWKIKQGYMYKNYIFMTQYQNAVMSVKWKITRFYNWLQSLWLYLWVEVFRYRMLILIGDWILLTNSDFKSKNAKITGFWNRVIFIDTNRSFFNAYKNFTFLYIITSFPTMYKNSVVLYTHHFFRSRFKKSAYFIKPVKNRLCSKI